MTMHRTHQRGGLPARMLDYFERNPTEELTILDAMEKFNAKRNNVCMAARRLADDGRLDYERIIRPFDAKGPK